MGMRISTTRIYDTASRRLMDNLARLYDVQEGIATGKKLRRPEDAPVTFTRVQGYKGMQGRLEQYKRNISGARGYLAEAESSLQAVTNLLSRAKELAMQGASGGLDAETLAGVTEEVSGIYDQVLSLANARWSGGGVSGTRHLFSGFKSDVAPFDQDGTYHGDGGEFAVETDVGETVTIGLAGDRVFQGEVDVFAVLGDLREALEAGDAEGVQATLEGLDRAIGQIGARLSEIGGRENRLDQTETRIDDLTVSLTALVSGDEDLDLIQASSKLTYYQTVLEASMLTTKEIFQTLGIF